MLIRASIAGTLVFISISAFLALAFFLAGQ